MLPETQPPKGKCQPGWNKVILFIKPCRYVLTRVKIPNNAEFLKGRDQLLVPTAQVQHQVHSRPLERSSLNASPLPLLPRPEGIDRIWNRKQCPYLSRGLHAPNQGWSKPRLYRPGCHDYHGPFHLLFYSKPPNKCWQVPCFTQMGIYTVSKARTWSEPIIKKKNVCKPL